MKYYLLKEFWSEEGRSALDKADDVDLGPCRQELCHCVYRGSSACGVLGRPGKDPSAVRGGTLSDGGVVS